MAMTHAQVFSWVARQPTDREKHDHRVQPGSNPTERDQGRQGGAILMGSSDASFVDGTRRRRAGEALAA